LTTFLDASWAEPLIVDEADDMLGGGRAIFNEARTHRYLLERWWGDGGDWLTWVMLNPSTAGAFANDPTATRVIRFTRRNGYDGLRILNVNAYQATDPRELATCDDPVGPCNDRMLAEHTRSGPVVAAWGAGGGGRGRRVAAVLRRTAGLRLVCLGTTKAGHPRHPLYVPADQPFVPWAGTDSGAGQTAGSGASSRAPAVPREGGGGAREAQRDAWQAAEVANRAEARRRVLRPRRGASEPSYQAGGNRRMPPGAA